MLTFSFSFRFHIIQVVNDRGVRLSMRLSDASTASVVRFGNREEAPGTKKKRRRKASQVPYGKAFFGNPKRMNVGGNITIEFWVRIDSLYVNSQNNVFISHGNEIMISYQSNNMIIQVGSAYAYVNLYNQTIDWTSWTHVAVTLDGSSVYSYINGQPVHSQAIQSGGSTTTDGWVIGSSPNYPNGGLHGYMVKRGCCGGWWWDAGCGDRTWL